jgi:hypothetical protein
MASTVAQRKGDAVGTRAVGARCFYCAAEFYIEASATVAEILEQEGTSGAVCDAPACVQKMDAAMRGGRRRCTRTSTST